MNREFNQKKWQEIIDHQRSSGLTQKLWCEANDINIHNFRYWVNRLKVLASETDDVRWVSFLKMTGLKPIIIKLNELLDLLQLVGKISSLLSLLRVPLPTLFVIAL